jgi:nicotinamide riboside kinase
MRAPEKIAFVGTLSSGKSTLFDKLQKKFQDAPGVVFLSEVARKHLEEHPEDKKRVKSAEIQSLFQSHIIRKENEVDALNPALVVCDRSVFDSVVYLEAWGDTENAGILFDRVKGWVRTYDWLFLLDPTNVPYEQDDVRTETPQERELIHRTFVQFFQEHTIPYRLLTGTPDEKYTTVLELLVSDLLDDVESQNTNTLLNMLYSFPGGGK